MIWLAVIVFLFLSAAGAITLGALAVSVNKTRRPIAKFLGFAVLFLLAIPIGIGPFLAGAAFLYYSSEGFSGLEQLNSIPMLFALALNFMIQYWGVRIGLGKITNDGDSALRSG